MLNLQHQLASGLGSVSDASSVDDDYEPSKPSNNQSDDEDGKRSSNYGSINPLEKRHTMMCWKR